MRQTRKEKNREMADSREHKPYRNVILNSLVELYYYQDYQEKYERLLESPRFGSLLSLAYHAAQVGVESVDSMERYNRLKKALVIFVKNPKSRAQI